MATSELRRSDRHAVIPYHVLYVAMNIMGLRVRDLLTVAFKHIGKDTKITRERIENEDYVNSCIETNFAFLKSIPNSLCFYQQNNISSDDEYRNILRAGIKRPRVFVKRGPSEKWHNPFNRFILNLVKSNMGIQFITDEYSCGQYVDEYVNKTNRGISNLQREIIKCMDEHPEFEVVEITRKLGVEMLNSVEISNQEAVLYLLRQPMSKCSSAIVYIPTMWPEEC
ncbi:ATP-dependent DNA helicase [Trichonephila clavipes]|nr:ATP-dependent DNA helicase [Trichonephila clavipes]